MAKYGSIMASRMTKGGAVGGDPSLMGSSSPRLTRESILRWASRAHSLSAEVSDPRSSVMTSLTSSDSESRDVGPRYLSLEPLLWSVRKRPRGLVNVGFVTESGDHEAGDSSMYPICLDRGLAEADETVEGPSKSRFREF